MTDTLIHEADALAYHKDSAAIAAARDALEILRTHATSLRYGAVITDDGFEVANSRSSSEANNRMAAMVSSMQALSAAIVQNLEIGTDQPGDNDYAIIAAPKGYAIQMAIKGHPLVLAASFDANETAGKALTVTRMAARAMAQLPPRTSA